MPEYVKLTCVCGPEDGTVVEVVKHFANHLFFPVRQYPCPGLDACDKPALRREMLVADYIISWRTGNAYFDGINT
jgi:hypothetical protein